MCSGFPFQRRQIAGPRQIAASMAPFLRRCEFQSVVGGICISCRSSRSWHEAISPLLPEISSPFFKFLGFFSGRAPPDIISPRTDGTSDQPEDTHERMRPARPRFQAQLGGSLVVVGLGHPECADGTFEPLVAEMAVSLEDKHAAIVVPQQCGHLLGIEA